jgi:outer membrane protein OmpA-like peptidoglycan-associated protein
MRPNLIVFIAFFVLAQPCLRAQRTTVVNHFQGDTTGRGLSGFRLAGTEEHRVVINYYQPAPPDEMQRLSQVIGAALNFYIDQSIEVKEDKITWRKSSGNVVRDMNEIVRSAVKYYNFRELESFSGFSGQVVKKVKELDGMQVITAESDLASPGTTALKQQQYFFVQKNLNELKLLANLEVGNYGNSNLLVYVGSESSLITGSAHDSLLQSLLYTPGTTLRPVYSDSSQKLLAELGTEDRSFLVPGENESPPDAFTDKIVTMLEKNSAKLDAMQQQIDALRAEQVRQWQIQQETRNDQMQAQINDLRNMVKDLILMNSGGALTSSGNEILIDSPGSEGGVYNIPSSVSVYFASGSVQLNANSVFTLNEVVDILARNRSLKLMISGYADKAGNPLTNLALSQQRASVVKAFLRKSGFTEDRFITRYLGDSNSEAPEASDRKVTLEFIR